MRRQKRLAAFLLALALLCGLAVPAGAEYANVIDITGAVAGGTTFVDYDGYTHTLSSPIQYILKAGDFYELPKNSDFDGFLDTFDGNRQVLVVPTGTVLTMHDKVVFWDLSCTKVDERNGSWSLGKTGLGPNYPEDPLPSYTFTESSMLYKCFFALKSDYTGGSQVYVYTLGPNGGFKAPGTSTAPAAPTTPAAPAVTQPSAGAAGAKESPVKADPAVKPWGVDNSGQWNYKTYGRTVDSYLYQRSDGLLTRVQLAGGMTVVEVYDQNFQILTAKQLPSESGMGSARGFFAGKDYNFLIYGAQNLNQSDSQEVIRVVKYSKDWERLGQASLKGANTTVPFDFGSLRCAEYNGILYIRTCHKMYKSSDGLNHQSNMTVAVRQSDMAVADATYTVGGGGAYVSHSFNQYILIGEDGTAAFLDHGDAYPRAAVLKRHSLREGTTLAGMVEETVYLQKFPGQIGDNETNASIGGLAESASNYLAVGNLGTAPGSSRDVMLYAASKSNFTSAGVRTVKLAAYAGTSEYGATPQIVKISNDRFLVMWAVLSGGNGYFAETGAYKLAYVFVDGSGNPLGAVQTGTARCSDCQPILYNGKVVWYSGTAFAYPTFYAIDASTGALTAKSTAA